ncbi:MAG: hypothetical protein QG665_196 [Patescibacteria group bacterium]|nr:hypothetical protein [Patescibacteria group bacterium]
MKKILLIIVVIILSLGLWKIWPSQTQTITVFFLDTANFNIGREPYEKSVVREVAVGDPMKAVLQELIKGPTSAEQAIGLAVEKSAATSLRLEFNNETGLARVYLEGGCDSRGSTYTIGNLIVKNLRQFPDVKRVYIYDPAGSTLGTGNEPFDLLPDCLQP